MSIELGTTDSNKSFIRAYEQFRFAYILYGDYGKENENEAPNTSNTPHSTAVL